MRSAVVHQQRNTTCAPSVTPTSKRIPWLAAVAGAVTGAVLAFVAIGVSGGSGVLGLLVCLPGLLLFALLTTLPIPPDGLPYTSLRNDQLWQGALLVGVGSLLFWSSVCAAINCWLYARKQR